MSHNSDSEQIRTIVQCYFQALYTADVENLRAIFHPDAWLQAPGIRRSRDEWLQRVAERPVPADVGSPDDFAILSLEVLGEQAMVKLYCPLFENRFIDFLGLLKENGRWQIVNKMYAEQAGTVSED